MQWTSRGDVSIVELVVYFPSLFFAFLVCSRHGFNRAWGWIFTLILCLVRIIGACCQLATYHDQSKGLFEATFILEFVGLSPLLYATLGLLSRCIDSVHVYPQSNNRYAIITLVTHATVALALILSIVGGTSINIPSTTTDSSYSTPTTSKVGTILFVAAFFILLLLALHTLPKLPNAPNPGEKRLLLAVLLALPFIATRLVYSVLSTFDHQGAFNAFDGNVVVYGLMSVLMEFIVVGIYLVVGWFTDEAPVVQRQTGGRALKGGITSVGGGRV